MFDFEYKESVGFISYAAYVKSGIEQEMASQEEMDKAQEDISNLSEAVDENTSAILDEVSAREAAVEELNERIDSIPEFQLKVVDELPEEGDSKTIYLLKDEGKDTYSEYVYADGAWEKLGTEVDLSEYVLRDEFEDALGAKADLSDVYSRAEIDAMTPSFATKDEVSGLSGRVDEVEAGLGSANENISMLAEANLEQDALIALKADKSYTDSEVYKLTQVVGDLGGAVTYELPSPAGKSFNALMSNNGTVKLTDDVESGRFGPGITAKNTTKLNLNGHDLTITGLTTSSTQPAIMSRGTENLTIYGKGTIDAGGGVCIEANGVDSVINLTGSTTVYRTNRSGGELIYCYAGIINITNGTFRNDGANTAYLLNCYDANYKADPRKANIIVSSTSKTSGPKFYDFNPADNTAEGEHTNFVAAGCEVVVSTVVEEGVEHTVYTVVKSAE